MNNVLKNILTILISLLLFINPIFGAELISPIKKGQTAHHNGFLINSEFEKARRQEHIELRLEKRKSLLLSDLNDVSMTRIDLYKKETVRVSSELHKAKYISVWKQMGWFALGVLTAGFGAYAVGRTLK